MRTRPAATLHRLMLAPLCCGAILSGCVDSATAPADRPAATREAAPAADIAALLAIPVAALTPDQALDERHVGQRVRWAGAVHHMTRTEAGVCLTMLFAASGEHGAPRWTPEPTYQSFKACTAGTYDPQLVHDSTNLTIVGRISGKAHIGMGGGGSEGPVIEIDKLFRWSDCLAGDDSPVCRYGLLTPRAVADD
jgi:hypothetical protein